MRGTASAQVAETTGRGAEVDIEGLSEEEAAEAIARARDEELRYPAELASAIRYTDISAGADVEYVLSGRSLKENITLAQKPTGTLRYTLELTCDGLTPINGAYRRRVLNALPACKVTANIMEAGRFMLEVKLPAYFLGSGPAMPA